MFVCKLLLVPCGTSGALFRPLTSCVHVAVFCVLVVGLSLASVVCMEPCTAQMSRVLGVRFGRLCESSLAIASVLEAGNMATSQWSNFASLNLEILQTIHARRNSRDPELGSQTWEPKKRAREGPQDNPHDGDDDDGDETRVERGCL